MLNESFLTQDQEFENLAGNVFRSKALILHMWDPKSDSWHHTHACVYTHMHTHNFENKIAKLPSVSFLPII